MQVSNVKRDSRLALWRALARGVKWLLNGPSPSQGPSLVSARREGPIIVDFQRPILVRQERTEERWLTAHGSWAAAAASSRFLSVLPPWSYLPLCGWLQRVGLRIWPHIELLVPVWILHDFCHHDASVSSFCLLPFTSFGSLVYDSVFRDCD